MRIYQERYIKDGKRVKARKWYLDFFDHLGRRHRMPGFAEKRATAGLVTPLSNLISCRASGM